ncbi:MAG: hypothetical protein M2R45_02272 [Verrucomicrobia subdivision 3 bacterium]|nr:hypothetical protein [Limisphaerales bacterium]MCS1413942.1 hypothetical protein [Limisphaerales bacterium]
MQVSGAICRTCERYLCRTCSTTSANSTSRACITRAIFEHLFTFADIVSAQNFKGTNECHG